MPTPPFWIRGSRSLIKLVAPIEDVVLPTAMALIRGDIADGTVAMLEVVPGDEAFDPLTS